VTEPGFTDDLLLAALDRAVRHAAGDPGCALAVSVAEHLAVSPRSGAWRQALRQLRTLEDVGLVEHTRHLGMAAWTLTDHGRERLSQTEVALPESPQHRQWRSAREIAAWGTDRFRTELTRALTDAQALLDGSEALRSAAWMALGVRIHDTAQRVAGAVYCLGEWPEPDDSKRDEATATHLVLRNAILRYARTLKIGETPMRWTIDYDKHQDAAIVTLMPVSSPDANAFENAARTVERVFEDPIASGVSASTKHDSESIELHITLHGATTEQTVQRLAGLPSRRLA
jgi:hypothetical protein